ncbi:papilin-like [Corticium candelabrum]|uniref:papilin-like n=1 Tax=Corticium candelabrum TaxID=121492 RepID=UPI002E257B46|nr:papilin-like [Corticium candelabrum]
MDPGLCKFRQLRYYYDVAEEKCKEFYYSGCFGNENNFVTKPACEAKCNGVCATHGADMTAEDCCKNSLKDQCKGEPVLDIDFSDQETKQGKVVVGLKLQTKNLQCQRVSRYRNADTLSLSTVESTVDGCNMRCPHFNSGTKYLVVVKGATINQYIYIYIIYAFLSVIGSDIQSVTEVIQLCAGQLGGGVCTESQPTPPPGNECRATAYQYYYNTATSECERYTHGPFYEGHNSFFTLDDCKDHCVKTNSCLSAMDPGLCKFRQLRYYYNVTEEK